MIRSRLHGPIGVSRAVMFLEDRRFTSLGPYVMTMERRSKPSIRLEAAQFRASEKIHDNKVHLLLAASGSVATIKLPSIITSLSQQANLLSIRIVLTKSATIFLNGQSREQPHWSSLADYGNVEGIYLDEDEWSIPWVRGNSILHIELRRWADLLVIAPLSANSLAKMANGMADNLLLSVIRAWDTTGEIDGKKKTIIVAPAMNTAMWRHPVTKEHLAKLEVDWGIHGVSKEGCIEVLRPVEKTLACGDSGDGAMREWSEVVAVIQDRLSLPPS